MLSVDPHAVATIIRDVAQSVVMPRYQTLAKHEISEKGPGDLVTVADHESELALTRRLADLLPGSLVVGEEAAAADPGVLANLTSDRPVWVIDPVDGTHNFAHGDPTFAMIVALVQAGSTRLGWIFLPIDDAMAMAEEGSGARIDSEPIHVDVPDRLEDLIGGVNYSLFSTAQKPAAREACHQFRECRNLRCSGREYVDMSRGRRHFTYSRQLKPWDHAAGILMHREAGGYSARTDDESPYRLVDPGTGLLVAPSRDLWHRIRDHLHAA